MGGSVTHPPVSAQRALDLRRACENGLLFARSQVRLCVADHVESETGGMLRQRWAGIPLARKLSLLFGTAFLLTISVTLVFPWIQMTALDEQAMLLEAKRVASISYQAVDLHHPSWIPAQEALEKRWWSRMSAISASPTC